jgi:hypothetical protein
LYSQKEKVMETLIVHLENPKKAAALKSVMKALDVKFESEKKKQSLPATKVSEKSPYDPEFVAKIKEGEADYKAGRFKVVKTDGLWK